MTSARFAVVYLLFLVAVLVAIDGVFYLFHISEIEKAAKSARYDAVDPRFVDPTTMLNLGWVSPARSSSFVHFDPQKEPGVFRIGCIGDSYTYGDEAGPNEDYPALLQELFDERGYESVEVINFGSSFYGFHQTFITWMNVAKRYSLDAVILGPRSFYRRREAYMNHAGIPLAIHARYILDGDDVRLVPVAGTTKEEVVDRYHRFIPENRYLKFDRDPPAFLKALIPTGRTLRNPFYYYAGTMEEEIDRTYRVLLTKMARETDAQIILSNFDRDITDLGSSIDEPNLHPIYLEKDWRFPNVMQRRHYSVHGNRLLARKYFWEITGDHGDVLESIEISDLPRNAADPETPQPRVPLSRFERLDVHIGASFAGAIQYDNAKLMDDAERRPHALLAISAPGSSVLNAIFVPLDRQIEAGETLRLAASGGGPGARRTIGRVALLASGLNIGVVETDLLTPLWKMSPPIGIAESLRARHPDASAFSLYLDDELIARTVDVERDAPVELRPLSGDFAKIRNTRASRLSLDHLEDRGTVSLVAKGTGGEALVVPVATYRLVEIPADVELDSLADSLALQRPTQAANHGSISIRQ